MDKNKDILSVSNSILIGSIFIASSIFLSGGMASRAASVANVQTVGDTAEAQPLELVERADAPQEGTGKVVVAEFADFQCPYCKTFWNDTYTQIKKNYIDTGKIVFEYRHYPLSFHVNAVKSAEAAECANSQGKFWPYYNLLFSKGQSDGTGLDTADLKSYAQDVGLDTAKFNKCLDSEQTKDIVDADTAEGVRLGISGTPSFLIGGKLVVGAQPYSVFQAAIEEALKASN